MRVPKYFGYLGNKELTPHTHTQTQQYTITWQKHMHATTTTTTPQNTCAQQ